MKRSLSSLAAVAAAVLTLGAAQAQSPVGLEHGDARVSRAPAGQALTGPSNAAAPAVVAGYLAQRRSPADIGALRTVRNSAGRGGVTHVRLEQEVDGLAVHGAYAKAAVDRQGRLVHLIDNLARVSTPQAARIDAQAALRAAMASVHPRTAIDFTPAGSSGNTTRFDGGAFFHRSPEVTAVAIPMSDGSLARGFLVETWTRRSNQLHHTLVGGTGRVLDVELRTASESYNVFPVYPGAAINGTQQVVNGPAAAPTAPSPSGWLFNVSQLSTLISGNNVSAYLDSDDNNAPDAGGSSVADGNFLASVNLSITPTDATNKAVAVQNLFYLNNVIHDILYRHGFNEAAANFQADNFGKGGRGKDPVQAEAQDGGGTDNANFATPSEGRAPRMQMYLWTGAGGTHEVAISGGPTYQALPAEFGPALNTTGISGLIVPAVDSGGTSTSDGCETISAAVAGKIALVDRGTCAFTVKAANAQAAGATGMIVANNTGGTTILTMGGTDATITIPSLLISQNDGADLRAMSSPTGTMRLKAVQPLQIDASLDSDIVYHEYCHGLTWRMIGRMDGPLAGAIGEGMSDGCALLVNDDSDVVAEYSFSNPGGIRRYPYTNYPLTYKDVTGGEVHDDGEIYAAIVWRMLGSFKTQYGAEGRDRLFGYIVDGMNYTPAKPAYEDMRDGILAAVAASGNTADCAKVWDSFARYGVGVGAKGTARGSRISITESMVSSTSCN